MTTCTFCSIVAGTARSWVVHEDETAVAVLDRAPATQGHTLVLPRVHAPDLWTLTADDAAAVMRTVHHVALLLREGLAAPGLNVMQSNGRAAGQEVLHYHVHLVPRHGGDGLLPPWTGTVATDVELDTVLGRLTS